MVIVTIASYLPNLQVEQLLRTAHALNRGAGLEGYVVCAQSSPQKIQKHTEALEGFNFSTEILYWKAIDGNKGNWYEILISACIIQVVFALQNLMEHF